MKKAALLFLIGMTNTIISLAQGVDRKNLDSLVKRSEETHSEAIILYKDNKLILEKYFGTRKPEDRIESMSCTKSIVGLGVACLLSDGLIDSLDVPVSKYFAEWRQGQKQLITIRHLVNMTSGIQNNPNASVEIYPSSDFVQLALAAELSNKPGEVWAYNNKALNLLAGVIKKITGKRMDVYIGERLFKPLGIIDFRWTLDSIGNPHVMSGCQIRPIDFAKIGLLVLNKGEYNNQQIITSEQIKAVLTPAKQYQGYGMLWWIDYSKTISIIDDEIIEDLRKGKLPYEFISKAIQMKGIYNSDSEYILKAQAIFGNNPWGYINQSLGGNLRLRKKEFSGLVTYRADGYLGNYIIVNPKDNVVAVRMITRDSYRNEKDNFLEFGKQVINLTKQ